MSLLWPWSLLGLAAVVAAAVWAIHRPARQILRVGSLELWREAVARLSTGATRSVRRISPAWLCLLVGAVSAVLAAARPTLSSQVPRRQVALAVWPSAELGDAGMQQLKAQAKALLGRLSDHDRVTVLRPAISGGATPWLPPNEAADLVEHLAMLPAGADELIQPNAPSQAQRLYCLGPPSAGFPQGQHIESTVIPVHPPAVRIDALAAEPSDSNQLEVFLALRNASAETAAVEVAERDIGEDGRPGESRTVRTESLPPNSRKGLTWRTPIVAAMAVEARLAGSPASEVSARAYLAGEAGRTVKVAIVGEDEPLLRRFVASGSALELAADPADADVIIANRSEPPSGKPAIVIDPPNPPPGWQSAGELTDVSLRQADVSGDSPLLRGADLSAVAIRRARPWKAVDTTWDKTLVGLGGSALIVQHERSPGQTPAQAVKRLYVAFDVSAGNTNLSLQVAFVALLANAMDDLSPRRPATRRYEYVRPLEAGSFADRQRIVGEHSTHDGPPGPGIYRDSSGRLQAVSLVGLWAEPPRPTEQTAGSMATASLPPPQAVGGQRELWSVFVGAAMMLWLTGWLLRQR